MNFVLILLSFFCILFCLDAPSKVSNTSNVVILIMHLALIAISYKIIRVELSGRFTKYWKRYYSFFLVGYIISLCILAFLWTPYLYKTYSTGWDAFDPIKYYALVNEMISGINVTETEMFPVLYIYYAEMELFGVNPYIPLFFNQLFFLYAVLILSKYLNEDSPCNIKDFAWLLLIPEALYFNVTSSKDVICMICSVIIFVHSNKIIQKKYDILNVVVIIGSFLVMFFARTSMAMMAVVCVIASFLMSRRLNRSMILLMVSVTAILSLGVFLSERLEFVITASDLGETIANELSGDMSDAIELKDQQSDAFANKLIPHNTQEFLFFGIIRSVVYALISPGDFLKLFDLVKFNHNYMCYLTSLLMTLSWPILILSVMKKRNRNNRKYFSLIIVVSLYVLAVGMFNPLMIHRRYRIVYDVLFFALAIQSIILLRSNKESITIRNR